MDELRSYLNSLSTAEQVEFGIRCGTTIGYLRKALSKRQKIGVDLAVNIDRESDGRVPCETLRPDVDWQYLADRAREAAA